MTTPPESVLIEESPVLEELPSPAPEPTRAVGMGTHYLRYSSATILMMAAGLISFPVLTRLLDNTQFGILGYYDTWLMMAVTIMKLGGQHAILRMYPFGGDQVQMTHFTTNLVFLPMMVSVGFWLLALAVMVGAYWWGALSMPPVFWCAVLLIPMMVFTSQIEMTLRVSERSGLLTTTRVSWRWLELVLIIGIVATIQRSALAVYTGKIAAALILLAFYVRWVHRHLHFSRKAIDLHAYRRSLRYGLPLVANEIAAMSLISIDRIMLKHLQGDYEGVGVFTVGCALAMQIGMLMNDPLMGAFDPVANRLHGTDGAAEVRALKARMLVPVTYASIGFGVAIWAVGQEAIAVLAGADKGASGPVFAWLGAAFAMLPLLNVSGYGLLLQQRTMTVLGLTGVAAATNIGLNFLWIPTHGVMGAVYATVVSYALLSVGKCVLCPRDLLQMPDGKSAMVAAAAAVMFLAAVEGTDLFGVMAPWGRVTVAGGLWLLLFLLPVMAWDSRLRHLVLNPRGGKA